jgi:predicted aminopeptidase
LSRAGPLPAAPSGRRLRWRPLWASVGLAAASLAGLACLTGCANLGYYAQSVHGHLSLLSQARPVTDWLADPATPAALRERLALAQRLRRFASTDLGLPDNASYHRYADLGRPAVVWNVVAAPELSLKLKTWCFPVMGCVAYRGYFDRAAADAEAATLQAQGWEVSVYGVPAYSTLGWTNWLGGDPLLNTFVRGSEADLARLVFHELAHQVVYVADDTMFNESYATAVERLGLARWQAAGGGAITDPAREQRRGDFKALTLQTREALKALYDSDLPDATKRERKARLMQQLRERHAALKAGAWAGDSGYDGWMARANNASLALQATYDGLVPAFERLHQQQGGDSGRFHAEVARLARMPRAERLAALEALLPARP